MDLSDATWQELERGTFTGPDGQAYSRRSTRVKRSAVDADVRNGAPVVVRLWSAGQLIWHEGADAIQIWSTHRPALAGPGTRDRKGISWSASRWETGTGSTAILLSGEC